MTEFEWNQINQSLLIYSVLGSTEGSFYYQTSGSQVTDTRYSAAQVSTGDSGLSFGMFQQDVAVNPEARARFNSMVDDAIAAERITATVGANYKNWAQISWSNSNHHQFTAAELSDISTNVLQNNKSVIDAGDQNEYVKTLTEVQKAENAALAKWGTLGVFDPTSADYKVAVGLVASWSNRADGLNEFTQFMSGATIRSQTLSGAPTLNDIRAYMQNTAYFSAHPTELKNVEGNIARGYNLYNGYVGQLEDLEEYLQNNPPLFNEWVSDLIEDGSWDPIRGFMNIVPRDIWGGDLAKFLENSNGAKELLVASAIIDVAKVTVSPLILDLNGDGVQATKLGFGAEGSTTYFDMDNDGFAERTAWITGGDGLLVMDKNGNGKIDNQSELFGNNSIYANGFLNLKQYDSNNDNKMTSADTQWANLRVWVDADGDGQTDAGELKTLSSLGITQINLGATAQSNTYINENRVSDTGTFVINGVTRTVSDVWFRNDTLDTKYLGDVTLNVQTLFLPTLKGLGNLKDLHVAMSLDASLLTLVQNFVSTWNVHKFENAAALDAEVKAILYKWAGVESVIDGSRNNFDAKKISFMEVFTGKPYVGLTGDFPVIMVNGAFEIVIDVMKAQLLVQAGAGNLFTSVPAYNLATGELSAATLSLDAITALKNQALSLSVSAREPFWKSVGEFLLNVKDKVDFTSTEVTALNNAINASGVAQTWESLSDIIISQYPSLSSYYGTDFQDLMIGSRGNDDIHSGDGNDTLNGGAGNDLLNGDAGNDTYVFNVGDGQDTISDASGTDDVILMGAGITSSNLRFEHYNNGSNLIIHYGASDKITIVGQYVLQDGLYASATGQGIETLKFADGSTINLNGGLTFKGSSDGGSMYGTNLADTLLGQAGNDSLYGGDGNDTLNGGAGNDLLNGDAGNDTVSYFDSVSAVTVNLSLTSAQNTVGAGIDTLAGLENLIGSSYNDTLTGDGNANTIEGRLGNDIMNGGEGIDIVSYASATSAVTVNLSLTTAQNTVGAGSDTLSNFENIFASAYNDTLTGNSGANMINGGAGNDTIVGGLGADILTGGLGADIFKFSPSGLDSNFDRITDFSSSQGDKIDVKDLLVGYDAVTKAITDFVEFTTVGANTVIKVDRDGAGTTYGWQQFAQLDNVTGLTDEAALKTSGNLIV